MKYGSILVTEESARSYSVPTTIAAAVVVDVFIVGKFWFFAPPPPMQSWMVLALLRIWSLLMFDKLRVEFS